MVVCLLVLVCVCLCCCSVAAAAAALVRSCVVRRCEGQQVTHRFKTATGPRGKQNLFDVSGKQKTAPVILQNDAKAGFL